MLVHRPKNRIGYADVADLKADHVVAFQHKFYPYFALGMGFIFPTLVAGLGWGDYRVCLKSVLSLIRTVDTNFFSYYRVVTFTQVFFVLYSFIMLPFASIV
jgi:fatty-acid desaturase